MGNKKKKKRDYFASRREGVTAEERERKRESFNKNKRYLIPLVLNTVLFYSLYALLTYLSGSELVCNIIMWVYAAALVGFALGYIIYNRGLSRKNVTVEMLPDTMSCEEKQAYLDEITRRADKSKWMITIIFPLVMTFMIDTVLLFMIEPLIEKLGV